MKREYHDAYFRGWIDGAACRPINPLCVKDLRVEYLKGWQDGKTARRNAMSSYDRIIGYVEPQIKIASDSCSDKVEVEAC